MNYRYTARGFYQAHEQDLQNMFRGILKQCELRKVTVYDRNALFNEFVRCVYRHSNQSPPKGIRPKMVYM